MHQKMTSTSLLFTFADGSTLHQISARRLIAIPVWEGNRVLDEDHVTDLTRERMVDLLTGRVISLVNGGRVTLILAQGEAGEKAVYHLTERDTARLLRGWKRLVFGGSGRSLPLVCASDEEALNLLRRTPDGLLLLSQVDETELPTGLQVVALP